MRHLLIVIHQPSANTRLLAEAVLRGACHAEFKDLEVRFREPLQACVDDVLWADGIVLGTTENFGYMSGALKDFFDRVYYSCLDKTEALPYVLFVRAGNDGSGARTSVERIVTGLRWRAVQEPLIMAGDFNPEFVDACEELGMAMAAGLDAGIF